MEDDINDFEAGYSDNTTAVAEKPMGDVKEDAPVEKVEEKAEVEKVEEEISPAMKELLARFEKIESRTRNVEGHIGGLTSHMKSLNETLAASRAAAQNVSEAPTTAQVREAMESPKEWEDLKGDFPEWAAATEKLLESRLGKKDDFQKVLDEKLNGMAGQISEKGRYDAGMEALNVAFPDWESDVKTDEFKGWFAEQSDEVKALAGSTRPSDAARMLRLFDRRAPKPVAEEKPSQSSIRQDRMRAAITPKGVGGSSSTSSDIDDFMAGYTG